MHNQKICKYISVWTKDTQVIHILYIHVYIWRGNYPEVEHFGVSELIEINFAVPLTSIEKHVSIFIFLHITHTYTSFLTACKS